MEKHEQRVEANQESQKDSKGNKGSPGGSRAETAKIVVSYSDTAQIQTCLRRKTKGLDNLRQRVFLLQQSGIAHALNWENPAC